MQRLFTILDTAAAIAAGLSGAALAQSGASSASAAGPSISAPKDARVSGWP